MTWLPPHSTARAVRCVARGPNVGRRIGLSLKYQSQCLSPVKSDRAGSSRRSLIGCGCSSNTGSSAPLLPYRLRPHVQTEPSSQTHAPLSAPREIATTRSRSPVLGLVSSTGSVGRGEVKLSAVYSHGRTASCRHSFLPATWQSGCTTHSTLNERTNGATLSAGSGRVGSQCSGNRTYPTGTRAPQ